MVPIVFISMEKGSTCQQTPEHGNKMYEGGGTCTSVQPYITGSRAVFSKILTKSHDILQVYEPEGPPCLSRTVKRGSNRSRSGKRGSRILDRELRIENGELRIENRESRSEDRGSRIENGACQARSGKLMRMADRFRTEWKFQCSNTSCCFQMILHLSFEN